MSSPNPAVRKPLRIAAIGAGYVSTSQLRAWRRVEGAQLVAVCDRMAERAGAAAAEHGIAAYDDAKRMLAETAPDAVDILTTPDTHRALVSLAAEAGCAILCQKPLATSLEDAEAIVATARARDVRLMVNENFRWRHGFRWIKRELDAGTTGHVFYAGFNGRINVTRPSAEWPEGRLFTLRPYFRGVHELIILENALHWIDVSRFLFGEPDSVFCSTQRSTEFGVGEDTAVIVLGYKARTVVIQNAWGSYGYPYPAAEALVAVEGTHGTLFLHHDGTGSLARLGGSTPAPYSAEHYHFDSFVAAQQHFVDCLVSGDRFATDGDDNLKTLHLAMQAYEAARTCEVIKLPGVAA